MKTVKVNQAVEGGLMLACAPSDDNMASIEEITAAIKAVIPAHFATWDPPGSSVRGGLDKAKKRGRADNPKRGYWRYLPPAASNLRDLFAPNEVFEVGKRRKAAISRVRAIRDHWDVLSARQRVKGYVTCTGCGRADNHPDYWDVDHILTFTDGKKVLTRDDSVANLQLLCKTCNQRKGGGKTMADLWAANVDSGFGPGNRKAARDTAWWQVKTAIKQINPNSGLE